MRVRCCRGRSAPEFVDTTLLLTATTECGQGERGRIPTELVGSRPTATVTARLGEGREHTLTVVTLGVPPRRRVFVPTSKAAA